MPQKGKKKHRHYLSVMVNVDGYVSIEDVAYSHVTNERRKWRTRASMKYQSGVLYSSLFENILDIVARLWHHRRGSRNWFFVCK